MADRLVFYTHPMSRGRTVRWMLEELGQPYRTALVDFGTSMKAPGYLAINPMGKVPAIVHNGVVVTEAGAICAYLADAFPEAGLAPAPGSAERGAYLRWMFFAAGPLEAAATNKALGFVVSEDKQRMAGYGTMEDVVQALAGALAKAPHIAGAQFSAADVHVGSGIAWTMRMGMLPALPVFSDYVARIMARPAAERARAIDDALLAKAPPG